MQQNISGMYPNKDLYTQRQYQQPSFTANGTPISSGSAIQNNPIVSHAQNAPDSPVKFLAAAGISTAALMGINNYINSPLQTKEYDQTFFKKVESYVDRKTSGPKAQNIIDNLRNFKNWINKQIDKSEILSTLRDKPSIGGPQVQSQAAGARGHLASRAIEIMKKYKEENPSFTEFDAIIKKAEKDSYKYYDEIINTIRTSSANKTKIMSKNPKWGLGLVKNTSSLKEILNKDILINNYKSAGKSIGQKAAGYLMRGTECLTNGMFSGKGQVLIQALMIAQSFGEAQKAEKGEKFSTFMASLAELMSFVATMGIQMRVVNHAAGLKNIGLSKPEHKAYQKFVQLANKYAKEGDLTNYTRAVNKVNQLKAIAKANTKWYQKPIKWIGNLLSFGRINETIKPLKASKMATRFAKIPYGLKVGLGYVGRVALILGVVTPFFSGLAKKASYAIFGKPVKTLAKEKEAENAEQKDVPQQTAEQPKPAQQPPVQPTQQVQANPKPGNLLDTMQRNQANATPVGAQGLNQPAATSIQSSPDSKIRRTYIPSPILGVENTPAMSATRNARIDEVMRQADYAEAMAQKYL